jgi:hypothetical protein
LTRWLGKVIIKTMVKKLLASVLFSFLVLGFSVSSTSASMLLLKKDGTVQWQILASEDTASPKHSSLEIKQLALGQAHSSETSINLTRIDGEVKLSVTGGGENKSLDVTKVGGDLVEIEERPQARVVKIGIEDGKFSIRQESTIAVTDFPINVDSKSAMLSVVTPTGSRYLAFLPGDATESALRAKTLSKVDDTIVLSEGENGELSYQISGQRTINLFNLMNLDVPVKASVSATTGEILTRDEPMWFRVLGFMFS